MKRVILLLAAVLFITDMASAKDRKRRRKHRQQYHNEQHCGTPVPTCETPLPPTISGPVAMPETDFLNACGTMEQAKFDDDRMDIAKFIVDKNNLTTNQIYTMVKMFSFDDTRLELAKYAYASCIDQHNYYKLNDALTFSANKEALMAYLKKTKS